MTSSWAEKREDIDEGMASLPQPLRSQALARLQGLRATPPLAAGLKPHAPDSVIETQHFTVSIDPRTGAIREFVKRGRSGTGRRGKIRWGFIRTRRFLSRISIDLLRVISIRPRLGI